MTNVACKGENPFGTEGAYIVSRAREVHLDPGTLYESVIDLSSEGLVTAHCINLAAGILLDDLGLPNYFFETISKEGLKNVLKTIATSLRYQEGKVTLTGSVSHMQLDVSQGVDAQKVRIATDETRDSMETMLAPVMAGCRREYYYSPENNYYTYIIRPGKVTDYDKGTFAKSPFLFNLSSDYITTLETTRARYEAFLKKTKENVNPLIEIFDVPSTGETRIMFKSDFKSPQLPILRKIFTDHGFVLRRAYWEPYYSGQEVHTSICSVYILGELDRKQEISILEDLRAFLAFPITDITAMYVNGSLTFKEMLLAGNLIDITHMFIYRENPADKEILDSLTSQDQKDAFADRIQQSNKSEYIYRRIMETVQENPDLVKIMYSLFDAKFNPKKHKHITDEEFEVKRKEFKKTISVRYMDDSTKYDILRYMIWLIKVLLKTNFYKQEKRSFSFRFNNNILDPLVYSQYVYGVFFVNGHYACGTHMRAADIARGGLRLLRITPSNYGAEIDKAPLLNYALGPKAQRLKHKDICESGSKGVVTPHPIYAKLGMDALYDYAEGIMDLILMTDEIVDYLGKPEMIFFGPDEGTAPLMDAISYRTRERGYEYWRTITTGKSFGVPHDVYGMLENGDVFGLVEKEAAGTELQVKGKAVVLTTDMNKIYSAIGGKIAHSGMTTTCVMGTFRTLVSHYGEKEENLNLMMTGGPDGDLGSNEIQTYKGKICLVIDGGSILYDPNGLDKKELMKIAFMRHTNPRANTLLYPVAKLSKEGFMVQRLSKNVKLPDGKLIEDGAMFHRSFLTNLEMRKYIEKANIRAFIPCGGFKDTINHSNVKDFLKLFAELKFIVEGANVFFDDSARRYIAFETDIKQIKDSSANKGGVFSSSMAEVLAAFLLGDDYDPMLLNDVETRWALIKDVMLLVKKYSELETSKLIEVYEKEKKAIPLFELSVISSEQILSLQAEFEKKLPEILKDKELVWKVLVNYIPAILVSKLGRQRIVDTLNSDKLQAYRNAIISKKLAAMAFYKYAADWKSFLDKVGKDLAGALKMIVE